MSSATTMMLRGMKLGPALGSLSNSNWDATASNHGASSLGACWTVMSRMASAPGDSVGTRLEVPGVTGFMPPTENCTPPMLKYGAVSPSALTTSSVMNPMCLRPPTSVWAMPYSSRRPGAQ